MVSLYHTRIQDIKKKYGLFSRDFCLRLLNEYNVLVVPGTAFGDSGEGYVRVSYAANMEKLKEFIKSLKQLKLY